MTQNFLKSFNKLLPKLIQGVAKKSPHIISILNLESFKVFSINFPRFEDRIIFPTALIKDKQQVSFRIKSKYRLISTLGNYSQPLLRSDLTTSTQLPSQANKSPIPSLARYHQSRILGSVSCLPLQPPMLLNCILFQNKNCHLIAKYCQCIFFQQHGSAVWKVHQHLPKFSPKTVIQSLGKNTCPSAIYYSKL